ncbi:MAG: Organic solvent tolerance protein OstA [Chthonomonadales bacterium]|nr:Organic solvent tolerance protein OstA [Chthonomonadales bacterium]
MSLRNAAWFALLAPALAISAAPVRAEPAIGTINLTATRTTLLADGKHTTILRAEVRDGSGRPAGNGVVVQFQITGAGGGTLSQQQAQTIGGIAQVTLTSSPTAGVSTVSATVPGQAVATIDVLFTDDPAATFEGNNYMMFAASGYMAYSATDRAIEANGRNGSARMTFRNIDVTADRIQLKCDDQTLRAHGNITFKRGKDVLHATVLYYSLATSQGYAIAQDDKGNLSRVKLVGENLRQEPLEGQIPYSYVNIPDFQVKLIIVAKGITYFPGDRLQFRNPKFYQDQAKIMTLPFYELPLGSTELFSDQFISVGTSGFGLDLPLYFELSPHSTGIVYLRHQQPLGRGYTATEPGWSIDVIKGYNSQGSQHVDGAYGFTGLTRSDWGFRWTHSQEFNSATQGSFYLEFPHHDSLFSTANLTQNFKTFQWGANLSGGQTFMNGATNTQSNVYVQSQPHRLAGSKAIQFTVGTTFNTTNTMSHDTSINSYEEATEAINFRAFTRPLILDKRTTVVNSLSLGQQWSDKGHNGATTQATIAMDHTLPGGGSLNLTYDFLSQPTGSLISDGKHRISGTYSLLLQKRFQIRITGSTYLDVPDTGILADMSYRIDNHWRLLGSATIQRFGDASYQDIEFTLGHRLGARELQLTYSTFTHRISFDLTATRF